jgi:hypothetical protein
MLKRIGLVLALVFMVAAAPVLADDFRPGPKLKTVVSGVTTNTTSTAIAIPIGWKSLYGQVVGTGAVTQTQAIYGDIDDDATNGVLLCTITLSGTTRTQDACPPFVAPFAFYYVVTTSTTGTGATGAVYAMY